MNARLTLKSAMTDESRIVKLEANVQHLKLDVCEIKRDLKSLRDALDHFKAEFWFFKAEVAKEFGSLKTAIERAKLWMVITGVGTILSVWGAALALARFLKP